MQLIVNKVFKFLVIAIFLQGGFIILFATMLLANFGPSYIMSKYRCFNLLSLFVNVGLDYKDYSIILRILICAYFF